MSMPFVQSGSALDPFGAGRPDRRFKARIIPRKRKGRRKSRRVSDGRRALTAVSKLSRMMVQTKNFIDLAQSGVNPAQTWTFTNLTAIPEGDDIGTRSGREIHATQFNMRGGFTTTEASTTPVRLRLIVFIDYENRGATPAATDVFIADLVDSLMNYSTTNLDRFKVIYDRYFVMSKGSATGEVNVPVTFNRRLNHRIEYNANLGTDESRGQVYLGYCVDSTAGAQVTMTLNTRVWFIE